MLVDKIPNEHVLNGGRNSKFSFQPYYYFFLLPHCSLCLFFFFLCPGRPLFYRFLTSRGNERFGDFCLSLSLSLNQPTFSSLSPLASHTFLSRAPTIHFALCPLAQFFYCQNQIQFSARTMMAFPVSLRNEIRKDKR